MNVKAGATSLCQAVPSRSQERFPGRARDRGSCAAAIGSCVPLKTDGQLDLQALHRVRSRLISERTAVINQIRGFLLEHGIPVRRGLRFLRQQLPDILARRRCLSRRQRADAQPLLKLLHACRATWWTTSPRARDQGGIQAIRPTLQHFEAGFEPRSPRHRSVAPTAPGSGSVTSPRVPGRYA